MIEGERGFSPPELMIVYDIFPITSQKVLELHGFPPWQMRLTEIYHSENLVTSRWKRDEALLGPVPIAMAEFGRALDQYSQAEMRLGK